MGIVFKKLADVVSDGKIKLLVEGFAGSGKTTLLATLPGRGIVISAEAGLLSLRRLVEAGEVKGDVSVAEVKNIDDVREAYAAARSAVAAGDVDWVALDSVSEIAEAILAAEKLTQKHAMKAYGEMQDQMVPLIKSFRDLACDVYLIVKAELWKADDDTPAKIRPMLPGNKLASALPYLVDEVLYLSIHKDENGEPVRLLQTAAGTKVDAKDRSGKLDPLEPADLGHILAKIRGQ